MAKFEQIQSIHGDTWEVHRAGCADVRKKVRKSLKVFGFNRPPNRRIEDRIRAIVTDDIDAYPAQAATEMNEEQDIDTGSIDPETGEDQFGQQGWPPEFWRVMPCCKERN